MQRETRVFVKRLTRFTRGPLHFLSVKIVQTFGNLRKVATNEALDLFADNIVTIRGRTENGTVMAVRASDLSWNTSLLWAMEHVIVLLV